MSALWLSDWSSPSFQQLSGVTQTCATKSLGMVWRVRACLEGNDSSGWVAFEASSGPTPVFSVEEPELGLLLCGLYKAAWARVILRSLRE